MFKQKFLGTKGKIDRNLKTHDTFAPFSNTVATTKRMRKMTRVKQTIIYY
jgi:hypothetical protein